MVMVFVAKAAVTPDGNPVEVPMPVAPVVAWVMLVKTVLIHKVGDDEAAPAVLFGVTMIVPVAVTLPQPPVNGIL